MPFGIRRMTDEEKARMAEIGTVAYNRERSAEKKAERLRAKQEAKYGKPEPVPDGILLEVKTFGVLDGKGKTLMRLFDDRVTIDNDKSREHHEIPFSALLDVSWSNPDLWQIAGTRVDTTRRLTVSWIDENDVPKVYTCNANVSDENMELMAAALKRKIALGTQTANQPQQRFDPQTGRRL